MSELSMYTNEVDYIIAESEEEAVEIMQKMCGYSDMELSEFSWDTLDPDYEFKFRDDDEVDITKPVKEWIAQEGKGYFACSEY